MFQTLSSPYFKLKMSTHGFFLPLEIEKMFVAIKAALTCLSSQIPNHPNLSSVAVVQDIECMPLLSLFLDHKYSLAILSILSKVVLRIVQEDKR